jgi:hypothetical protein
VLVEPMDRDFIETAVHLTRRQVRHLVNCYLTRNTLQQLKTEDDEICLIIEGLLNQAETLENTIKRLLNIYNDTHPIGKWLKSIRGITPIYAAGLLSYIDIKKAPTAGHIWSYAGLVPQIIPGEYNYNPSFKRLCLDIGNKFAELGNSCFYGRIYNKRKTYELEKKIEKAAVFLQSTDEISHNDKKAKRYAVKMFLSHLQAIWYEMEFREKPANPYAIDIAGNTQYIPPINSPFKGKDTVKELVRYSSVPVFSHLTIYKEGSSLYGYKYYDIDGRFCRENNIDFIHIKERCLPLLKEMKQNHSEVIVTGYDIF